MFGRVKNWRASIIDAWPVWPPLKKAPWKQFIQPSSGLKEEAFWTSCSGLSDVKTDLETLPGGAIVLFWRFVVWFQCRTRKYPHPKSGRGRSPDTSKSDQMASKMFNVRCPPPHWSRDIQCWVTSWCEMNQRAGFCMEAVPLKNFPWNSMKQPNLHPAPNLWLQGGGQPSRLGCCQQICMPGLSARYVSTPVGVLVDCPIGCKYIRMFKCHGTSIHCDPDCCGFSYWSTLVGIHVQFSVAETLLVWRSGVFCDGL